MVPAFEQDLVTTDVLAVSSGHTPAELVLIDWQPERRGLKPGGIRTGPGPQPSGLTGGDIRGLCKCLGFCVSQVGSSGVASISAV